MTVKRNNITQLQFIAMLIDWLNNLSPIQPMKSKTKTDNMEACACYFSFALSKFCLIARNSDWFITLFAPVVINQSNNNYYYFGISFSTVI